MALDVFPKLDEILEEIKKAQVQSAEDLEAFRVKFLGSKNVIKSMFGEMKNVPNELKKSFGQRLNELKEVAQTHFDQIQHDLKQAAQADEQQSLDLTAPATSLPKGSRHPISIVMSDIINIFSKIGFAIAEEREVEDDWHNFTAMNTPADHPARDMQDTFYILNDPEHLLRTHTSSVQARIMTTRQPPIRIIAPGRVYRNETVSARSHCQFHQVEGLYIDKDVSFADLKKTLLYYASRENCGLYFP